MSVVRPSFFEIIFMISRLKKSYSVYLSAPATCVVITGFHPVCTRYSLVIFSIARCSSSKSEAIARLTEKNAPGIAFNVAAFENKYR